MSLRIHLAKSYFKFSSAHFTIMSPKTAERLHGHNYQVKVSLDCRQDQNDFEMPIEFNTVKPIIRQACDEWDEYVLLPEYSPYLKLHIENSTQVHVEFAHKKYQFPLEDTLILPVKNITAEALAELFWQKLAKKLQKYDNLLSIAVTVAETHGQSVTYKAPLVR